MQEHRAVLVGWAMVVAAFLGGVLAGNGLLAFLAEIVAMLFAIGTFRRTDTRTALRYPLVYRVSVALLLVTAVTCLVSAGGTVFIVHRFSSSHIAGFAALATSNLLLSILAWRALVRPMQRRAALAGLFAVIVEIVALIFDVVVNMERRVALPGSVVVTLYASFIATWAGALVCMSALGTFDRANETPMPEARVVDEL